jgi:hypothetical protein
MTEDKPYDFRMNPQLKAPEGAVGHAAVGPFLSQQLLDKYLQSKGRPEPRKRPQAPPGRVFLEFRTAGKFPS